MIRQAAVLFLALVTATATPGSDLPARPTQPPAPNHPATRKAFLRSVFGKPAWIATGTGAVVGQIRRAPDEWPRNAGHFAARAGSAFGQHMVKSSVMYGIAAVRHEDLSYHPSGKQGFGPRLKYALISTVYTQNTKTGQGTPAVGRVAGSFAGGFISRLWMPARLHTFGSGFSSGGISLGVDAGLNVTARVLAGDPTPAPPV